MMFQRKPSHNYLGDVWRVPDNRHDKGEEDHNLYFDGETGCLTRDISVKIPSCNKFRRHAAFDWQNCLVRSRPVLAVRVREHVSTGISAEV